MAPRMAAARSHKTPGAAGRRQLHDLNSMLRRLRWAAYVACAIGALAPASAFAAVPEPAPVAAVPAAPMSLISRGAPAYASSGTASLANDASYGSVWRSSGVPATLTLDLSGVPAPRRRVLWVVWYNEVTYGYDHAQLDAPAYNNLGSYTVEVNASPGGGAPPSDGWVTVETVARNTLHSRDHVVPFTGYQWLRIAATAADGSPGNSDVALNLDVYDAGAGVSDGWLFVGDSITAGAMGHSDLSSGAESFTNALGALSGVFPAQQNAGMPGWTALVAAAHLPAWLKDFHGRYVPLAFGTNDAAGEVPPRKYLDQLSTLVAQVLASGKIPVVPTIPWSREATHARNLPGLNAQILALYRAEPRVVPGPDLYTFFHDHPELISADGVHPTDAGYAALRGQWAAMARRLYPSH